MKDTTNVACVALLTAAIMIAWCIAIALAAL